MNNFDIERYITIDVETKNKTLKTILQLIRAYTIPNILDLHDFIEEHGESYGIDMNLYLTTVENKSSILRLYFDGAYQKNKTRKERKRGKIDGRRKVQNGCLCKP